MDPEKLKAIEEWYDAQKELIEKAFLEKARANPLDAKAKETYETLLRQVHEKFELLSQKEIQNKHLLKKTLNRWHEEILAMIDKVTEVYKE